MSKKTFREKTEKENVEIIKGKKVVDTIDILFYQENEKGGQEIVKAYGWAHFVWNFNRQNKADIANPIRTGQSLAARVKATEKTNMGFAKDLQDLYKKHKIIS